MKTLFKFYTPIIILFSLVLLTSKLQAQTPETSVKNGFYLFQIHRNDGKTINFNAEITNQKKNKQIHIINGNNRLSTDSIWFQNDSLRIELPYFESGIVVAILPNGNLSGQWVKHAADKERRLPITATFGEKRRFLQSKKAGYNIGGRWQVDFLEENKTSPAVGEFQQKGNYLTGTFLTPYGDYRYLSGIVSGDSLFLSGFDGSYALYFTGKIHDQGKQISGILFSGAAAPQEWKAIKNKNASLPDSYSMTKIRPDAGKLNFTFPDINGKPVSINDEQFKNKVIVIQILGSWCPNCIDETKFITENYDYYKSLGVEFIGLAYERTDDFEKSRKALLPFIQRVKPTYPILIPPVAVSDTLRTEKTLPQLDKISAFPSTIFVDKKGMIRKVYAGFDGPATGEHYIKYKKEFEDLLKELANE